MILIVVLALLTLFTLVGISFVLYADAACRGTTQFRADAFALAEETLDLAETLGADLVRSEHERVDFEPQLTRIAELARRADCLKPRVCLARDCESDPQVRRNLDALASQLELYEAELIALRWFVEEIWFPE